MPKFPFDFEAYCRKAAVDPVHARSMTTKVEGLFAPAMKVEGFYDQVLDKLHDMGKYSINNLGILHRLIFEKVKPGLDIELREISMLFLLDYLVVVESFYSDVIDLLCFALLAAHHDIADFYSRKYVTKLSELEEIPLADKLRFLSLHGWNEAEQAVDRPLRNAIAHGNYRIDEDGLVLVQGRTLTEDDCSNRYQDIRTFVYEFWVGMNKFFVENYSVAYE